MLDAMNIDQFTNQLASERGSSPAAGRPGRHGSRADTLRALLAAEEIFLELATDLAAGHNSPVTAAMLGLVVERTHRRVGFTQILAAEAARATLAHELPVQTLNQLRGIIDSPADFRSGHAELPADPPTIPSGRPPHKDTPEFLQQLLGVSFYEARDRITAADSLLEHTDINGVREPVRYPDLAGALRTGHLDTCAGRRAAKKMDKLRPVITKQPHAARLASDIESQILDSLLTQNEQGTNQLFDAIERNLIENRQAGPDDAEIRAKTGVFFTRRTRHFTYLSICVRNADAELFYSHFALSDNPRTKAGNRKSLLNDARRSIGTDSSPQETLQSEETGQDLPDTPEANPVYTSESVASAPSIPEWAIDPEMPIQDRPRATYTDLGQQVTAHGNEQQDSEPDEPVSSITPQQHPLGETERSPESLQIELNSTIPGADGLTRPMRHLQTLLNIMQADGTSPPGKTRLPRATLIVYCQLATLLGLTEKAGVSQHGISIPPDDLRRKLCDANVIPMVLDGKGQILDLGRAARFFPDYMRQAILARDGGCIVPGCTVPPEHCEIHHLKPYSEGGLTRIEDGTPVCANHHHSIHTGQIVLVHNGDGLPAVIMPKYIDPDQKARRNSFWGQQSLTQPQLF